MNEYTIQSLNIMWQGMFGIFTVIILIMLVVIILTRMTNKK
ncbi:hypothetical protein EDD66_106149 [Mobilisporobacter senegalensis]|uniref:Uncharacterized protein n=1 Tax=Mobilisporobacter senegalensis TaxID=1329262 RepID=A0A3N1XQU1_9FIRM|nr:sodium pump decarboxylase gamma subunit [Mobilisporobacter senegalensis]ROR27452.1 hypothetical protein EDD66_106149 [Mobilisporobacter senegalensis]